MDLIARDPSVSGLGKDVWFYIPAKNNVLSQPFVVCACCFNVCLWCAERSGEKIALSNNKNKTQYQTGRKGNINWWCW